MHRVVVIGGGASGLFAAYSAAISGKNVILIEKNEKLGKKIYITGKGRCNLTNAVDRDEFLANVVRNPKFLYSPFNNFSSSDVIDFFNENGCKVKVERGNRVFPASDKASDVTKTLEKALINFGVQIRLNERVEDILVDNNKVIGVKTDKDEFTCNSVIICTGGISYPTTGSTGDGYGFAKKFGHEIVELRPSLVGLELIGNDFLESQGVTLKNVGITTVVNDKEVYTDFGELLFTHFGVSGPIVISCSALINRLNLENAYIEIDLKPALDLKTLENRLLREFKENNLKNISVTMRSLLPKSLINVVLEKANVPFDKVCSEITVSERNGILKTLKGLRFYIKKLRKIEEAIVTSGGVDVKGVNPKTLESKLISGLFFAGEVLDVDAYTGGFNLQIAFSTGYTAGLHA